MQKSKLTKLLCLVLSLLMILGAVPLTAIAAGYQISCSDCGGTGSVDSKTCAACSGEGKITLNITSDEYSKLTANVNTPNAARILFGTHNGEPIEFVAIGLGKEGLTSPAGCLTLIATDIVLEKQKFSDGDRSYSKSLARQAMESAVVLTDEERGAIRPRTFVPGVNQMFDSEEFTVDLWLSEGAVVGQINDSLRRTSGYWWTMSMYDWNSGMTVITGAGGLAGRTSPTAESGIRPEFFLDLTKIYGIREVEGKTNTYTLVLDPYVYSAESNVLTATNGSETHTLTLTENGTISETEVTAWENAGLIVPEIIFNAAANTASITAGDATASITLAQGVLSAHTVKVICGADANGKSYITDVMPGTPVAVTAGTYEGKAFEKWIAPLGINGSTNETVTFTMPNEDITLEAEFVDCYPLSIFDGITLTSTPQKANTEQTVTAPDAPEGSAFQSWTAEGITLNDATAATLEFTMPANAVMLTPNYEAIKVTAPTAGTKTYTYNGKAQTYEFATAGDTSYYSLSGNVQTNAGTYTVKASLTVNGSVWADGTTADKEFSFVIARQPIDKPTAYNTRYYYDGTEQDFILCKQIGSSYYYYESTIPAGSVSITGNTRTNAGTQTVTVTPTANYCWSDGTTNACTFTFTVNGLPIPTLFEDPRSFTYNGRAQTYTPFVFLDGGLYDFDGYLYNLSNRTKTAAGSYTVTATLNDNYCWSDGSFGPKNFTFDIRNKELDSYIYYVDDLKTGENEVCVDMTYTSYDNTNTLKGFERHPNFKAEKLSDRYQPHLANVPAGADVMFYLKETPGTPKTIGEVNKCKRWDDVKMSDLEPDTIYYMFALVTHPDYPNYQITEVNNMSRFITSDPQFTLINCKRVKQTEVNQNYKFDCCMAMYTGNINAMLGAFGNKSTTKNVNVTTKVANYTVFEEAIAQGIKDIEEGLDGALIGWYDEHGDLLSYTITKDNLSKFKSVLANLKAKSVSAPKRMLAAPTGDPTELTPVEIKGIFGEVPEFTPELLRSLFTPEELALIPLDKIEFRVKKELETGAEQIEAEKEALLAKLAALDITPEEEAEGFSYTATVGNILYDPATGLTDGESNDYELADGEKLPAKAVKEIEGYTFIGLYYKEIMGFEKDAKSEDATGDHGMILTQGLVKWDPETDFVTRDLDLMALYVKDGAEEPVGYKADGTTFLDAGSEVTVTLPALLDGMTYGDVLNEDEDITVNAVSEGKVTVTLNNDVTGDEPFTFTVAVNANKEGIVDPFYYILVTVNAVDDAECKEKAAETIEALAEDTASDAVKAIISEAVASLEDANSIEAVNEIVADTAAAVVLQETKEEAIAAIDAAVAEAANSGLEGAADSAAAAAEEAKAAINAATTVEEVNEAEKAGTSAIVAASVCEHCGTKHQNIIFKIICRFIQMIYVMIALFTSIDF